MWDKYLSVRIVKCGRLSFFRFSQDWVRNLLKKSLRGESVAYLRRRVATYSQLSQDIGFCEHESVTGIAYKFRLLRVLDKKKMVLFALVLHSDALSILEYRWAVFIGCYSNCLICVSDPLLSLKSNSGQDSWFLFFLSCASLCVAYGTSGNSFSSGGQRRI